MTEAEEREERINEAAGKYFWPLVKRQRQRVTERLNWIVKYRGSPRWDREWSDIELEWRETTADAGRVYAMALHDLWATGEVSEATSYAYDEVAATLTSREIVA
jgi:hypothetical protein